MSDTKQCGPWGNYELMVIAAFRYCLGRTTYIVGECVHWLKENWGNFEQHTRSTITRELLEAYQRDTELRNSPSENINQHFPLGMACDKQEWESLLHFIEEDTHNKINNLGGA